MREIHSERRLCLLTDEVHNYTTHWPPHDFGRGKAQPPGGASSTKDDSVTSESTLDRDVQ